MITDQDVRKARAALGFYPENDLRGDVYWQDGPAATLAGNLGTIARIILESKETP